MTTIAKFRQAIRSKALKKDLTEVLAKHGLQLLEDDGIWVWLDDYTDTVKIHMREQGWADAWKWKNMETISYKPVVGES